MKRPPNCIVREVFACEVIVPKLLLVADDTAGALKLAWFIVLNTSNRSCAYMPSRIRKSFSSEESNWLMPSYTHIAEG